MLGINQEPVTIKQVEVEIIDNAFEQGWVTAGAAAGADRQDRRGRRFRAGGAGGRAAAHPRRPLGDGIRAGRPDRRAAALRHPGIQDGEAPPRPAARADGGRGHRVQGRRSTSASTSRPTELRADFDAVVLAGGATAWRDLPIPGRDLDGIHQAMEFLPWSEPGSGGRRRSRPRRRAADHRQGPEGDHHRRRRHRRRLSGHGPPAGRRRACTSSRSCRDRRTTRADSTPWPIYPLLFRVSSAHEEGGERVFSVNTEEFTGRDGRVAGLRAHEVAMQGGKFVKVDGTDFELEADLVLLAMGFVGPERDGLLGRPRRRDHRPRQCRARSPLRHQRARRVRRRRHGPWAVADRLGDRRRPRGGSGGGRLPDGRDGIAGADQAHRGTSAVAKVSTRGREFLAAPPKVCRNSGVQCLDVGGPVYPYHCVNC